MLLNKKKTTKSNYWQILCVLHECMQSGQQSSKSSIAELIVRWNLWILIGTLCEDTIRIYDSCRHNIKKNVNAAHFDHKRNALALEISSVHLSRFAARCIVYHFIRSWCSFLCDSQRTFNLFMPLKSTLIQMGPVNVCKCTTLAIFLHYFCCSQSVCLCVVLVFADAAFEMLLFFRENRGCCKKCTVFDK